MGRYESDKNAGFIQKQKRVLTPPRQKVTDVSDDVMKRTRKTPPAKCQPTWETGRQVPVKVPPQRKQLPPVKHLLSVWKSPPERVRIRAEDTGEHGNCMRPRLPAEVAAGCAASAVCDAIETVLAGRGGTGVGKLVGNNYDLVVLVYQLGQPKL